MEQSKLLALGGKPQQKPAPLVPVVGPAAVPAASHTAQFALLARAGLPDARAYFEQAVQAHPEDADARAGLAIALVFSGRAADAKYHVQRLNESSSQTAAAQTPGVRLTRGLMLGLEGNADSEYQFNRAQEDGADRALLALCRATVALHKKDFQGGQRFMEAYAGQTPESEQGPYARQLAERLNPINSVAGTFFWGTADGNVTSTYLIIERSGDGLKGTDGGGEYKSNITNMALQGLRLSFRMAYDLGFFLGGAGASDCVADFGQDLNRVPITCRDSNYGSMSSYLFRRNTQRP